MGERYAKTFESLRGAVLDRLMEMRSSIDFAHAAMPDHVLREQFDQILTRMQAYLADGQVDKYRGFLQRWAAIRVGEGYAAETLVHTIVSLGDLVALVAKARLGATEETLALCREVVRMSALASRVILDMMAEEFRRRLSQQGAAGASEPA